MKTSIKIFANICIVFVSVILLSAIIAPVSAHASTITFGAFNAPFGYQGFACAQQPVLVASGLHVGQILTASNISGSDCPRLWPRSGSCVNDTNAGCSEDGHSNLVYPGDSGGFDSLNKVGFYNGQTLIQEVNLTQLQNGVAVPCGATSAYVYFKDTVGDGNDFFDNNGGYHVTFNANVTTTNANACCSTSDCTTNQSCNSGSCINNVPTPTPTPVCGAQTVSPTQIGLYNSTAIGTPWGSPWIPNNSTSGWDVFATGSCAQIQWSQHDYTRTFYLSQKSDVTITGRFAADDTLLSTTVNGTNMGVSGGGLTSWTNFTLTIPASQTNSGTNTIDFKTEDTGCAITGFRVEFTGATVSNYIQNATKQCVNGLNAVYNFDSCGVQQSLYQQCTNNQICSGSQCINNCTPNSSQRCVTGLNAVYNFDSCGIQGSLYQQCTTNQTCANGVCVQNNLNVSATASPNPAVTNQSVNFTATPNGGTGIYSYSWTGACIGHSQTCNASFTSPGTYTAFVTVTSGYQTTTTSAPVVVNQVICSTNSQCGTNGFVGSLTCGANGNVYQNYITYTCNNAGTANSTCTNNTASQLKTTCNSNQTCTNGTCVDQPIACRLSIECGVNGYTGLPTCGANGNVYQNYTTYTCNNSGTPSSYCSNTSVSQLQTTCGQNQTCANGACSTSNLAISATASPNPAQTNQPVIFSSTTTGGIGSYNYYWYGACTGNSPTCSTSFPQAGTYTAYLFVSSGSQYQSTTAPVVVNQNCTPNAYQRCYNNNLYWYDSCNTLGGLALTCPNGCSTATNTCNNANLTVSATASPNPATTNQSVTFTANAAGGTGNYIYMWTGACTGSSQTCTTSFAQSGTYNANVMVTSGSQNQPASASVVVNQTCTPNASQRCYNGNLYYYDSCGNLGGLALYCSNGCSTATNTCNNASLTVSASASPNPAQPNQTVSFTAIATGGIGSYSYIWTGACIGNSQTCNTSFAQSGNYTANVMVTSGTQTQSGNASVSVSQNCTSHDHLGCVGTNSYWFNSCGVQQDEAQDCGFGTCAPQTGTCVLNSFSLTCVANPAQAYTNQNVAFNAYITLPTNNSALRNTTMASPNPTYTYNWSGACSGNSSICSTSFTSAGTKTANLSVTVGTVTKTTNCSTAIFQAACGSNCNH